MRFITINTTNIIPALLATLLLSFLGSFLLQPQTVFAFNDRGTGDRLLNEYKDKCSNYNPSRNKDQKWNRCKTVREALVTSAGCNFGNGKASTNQLNECSNKISQKFSAQPSASASGSSGGGSSTSTDLDCGSVSCVTTGPIKNGGVEAKDSTIISVRNIVFSLAGGLSLLFVVIGGFRYVLSSGDPNATAQAKNTIIYALVGLVVTVSGFAIVGFVTDTLL